MNPVNVRGGECSMRASLALCINMHGNYTFSSLKLNWNMSCGPFGNTFDIETRFNEFQNNYFIS